MRRAAADAAISLRSRETASAPISAARHAGAYHHAAAALISLWSQDLRFYCSADSRMPRAWRRRRDIAVA